MNNFWQDKKWYAGWLYCDRGEIEHLRELGVTGPMVWSKIEFNKEYNESSIKMLKAFEKEGTLSYCLCDEETMERLANEYQEWWETHYIYHDETREGKRYPYNHFSIFSLEQAKEKWGWTAEND